MPLRERTRARLPGKAIQSGARPPRVHGCRARSGLTPSRGDLPLAGGQGKRLGPRRHSREHPRPRDSHLRPVIGRRGRRFVAGSVVGGPVLVPGEPTCFLLEYGPDVGGVVDDVQGGDAILGGEFQYVDHVEGGLPPAGQPPSFFPGRCDLAPAAVTSACGPLSGADLRPGSGRVLP
jgi:hypothetical protein